MRGRMKPQTWLDRLVFTVSTVIITVVILSTVYILLSYVFHGG